MSANELITVEHRESIAIVRFANPPSGLIANKSAMQLLARLTALLADDTVRAIVLTGGEDDVFIRHADVGQIQRAADALARGEIGAEDFFVGPFPRLGRLLDGADKPVIAAINGVCMGGGLEIALACTARIASASVKAIGLPEIRIGIFPGAGGALRLQRLLGQSRAWLFMLRGAVVDAAVALELGIIDEVAPDALERALALAADFARRPAGAVAAILQLTRRSISDEMLCAEQTAFAHLLRDDASVRAHLQQFIDSGDRLDQQP